jgi:hypothetical protein
MPIKKTLHTERIVEDAMTTVKQADDRHVKKPVIASTEQAGPMNESDGRERNEFLLTSSFQRGEYGHQDSNSLRCLAAIHRWRSGRHAECDDAARSEEGAAIAGSEGHAGK